LTILNKLSWKQHIQYLSSKLSWPLLRNYVDLQALKTCLLQFCIFLLYLEYCISTWGTASNSSLDPLEKLLVHHQNYNI